MASGPVTTRRVRDITWPRRVQDCIGITDDERQPRVEMAQG